jgi:hypothetical protein
MNTLKILFALMAGFALLPASAQDESPKGFTAGKIVLADGSTLTGPLKDKIRSNASVVLMDNNKKKNYDGSDLLSADIGDQKFICIRGDFFKIICDGELKFLQKSSDASRKPIYNGNQAVFTNGTDGQPGDYFVYGKDKQLKLVTRKTLTAVAAESFAGCEEAIANAKQAGDDVAKLSEAVVIYNNRNSK